LGSTGFIIAWLGSTSIQRSPVACFRGLKKLYKIAIFPIHDSAPGPLDPFNKPPILVQSPDFFDIDLLSIRRGCCKGVLSEIAAQILTVFAVKEHVVVIVCATREDPVRRGRGRLGAQLFEGAAEFQSVEDVRQEEGVAKTPSKMRMKSSMG